MANADPIMIYSDPYDLAKYAMTKIVSSTEFPTEWWEARPRGSKTASKTARETLFRYQQEFDTYDADTKASYREFMTKLEKVEGYVRIVSQNMHCRDEGLELIAGLGLECSGEGAFYDNQPQRAIELAKRIQSGTMKADVIAIQELQSKRARKAFEKEMKKDKNYEYWLPNAGTEDILITISAGQGFVWDKRRVKLLDKKIWNFPTEISSGADARSTTWSFKGMAWGRFETIPANEMHSPYAFSVFNIHPSPYVQIGGITRSLFPRAEYDIEIVSVHLYQYTLISMKIKEIMAAQKAAGSIDTVFILGDWNVNKYFQNGFSESGVRSDLATAAAKTRSAAVDTVMGRGFRTVTEKNVTTGRDKKLIEQVEACFRDDIPFTGSPKCDYGACCGSEYMTCLEILGAIPPTHLYSISEHDKDIPAPYGGKYTWDGLVNSVMWSPFWSSRAFQLLDHIVYSKYGHIPVYAHTMTKRYLTTDIVYASEGPLSEGCRSRNKLPDNLVRYAMDADGAYRYVDLADHYAVECVAVLSYSPGATEDLVSSVPNFYEKARFWTDSFYPSVGDSKAKRLTGLQHFMVPKIWQFLSSLPNQKKFKETKLSMGLPLDGNPRVAAHSHFAPVIRRFSTIHPSKLIDYLPKHYSEKVINDFVFKMGNRLLEREYINRQLLSGVVIPLGIISCATKGNSIFRCSVSRKVRSPRGKVRAEIFKKLDIGEMHDFAEAYEKIVLPKDRAAVPRSPDLITTPERDSELKLRSPRYLRAERGAVGDIAKTVLGVAARTAFGLPARATVSFLGGLGALTAGLASTIGEMVAAGVRGIPLNDHEGGACRKTRRRRRN